MWLAAYKLWTKTFGRFFLRIQKFSFAVPFQILRLDRSCAALAKVLDQARLQRLTLICAERFLQSPFGFHKHRKCIRKCETVASAASAWGPQQAPCQGKLHTASCIDLFLYVPTLQNKKSVANRNRIILFSYLTWRQNVTYIQYIHTWKKTVMMTSAFAFSVFFLCYEQMLLLYRVYTCRLFSQVLINE